MRAYAAIDRKFNDRDCDVEGNIRHARKASCGNLPGPSGDIHTACPTRKKRRTRIKLNKRARTALRRDLNARLAD